MLRAGRRSASDQGFGAASSFCSAVQGGSILVRGSGTVVKVDSTVFSGEFYGNSRLELFLSGRPIDFGAVSFSQSMMTDDH
jgi:hypothetical protein